MTADAEPPRPPAATPPAPPSPVGRYVGPIDGVKIFAALAHSRPGNLETLSTEINQWLQQNPGLEFVDIVVKLHGVEHFAWQTVTMIYRFPPGVSAEVPVIPHITGRPDHPPWFVHGERPPGAADDTDPQHEPVEPDDSPPDDDDDDASADTESDSPDQA